MTYGATMYSPRIASWLLLSLVADVGAVASQENCVDGECEEQDSSNTLLMKDMIKSHKHVSVQEEPAASPLDSGPGDTAMNPYHEHDICPEDAADEATEHWMKYFLDTCKVAWEHVPEDLQNSIAESVAVATPCDGGKVSCIIQSGSPTEASNLMFTATQGNNFEGGWTAVDGTSVLMEDSNGALRPTPVDEDTSTSGVCSVFPPGIARTEVIEANIINTAFHAYKAEYNRLCTSDDDLEMHLVEQDKYTGTKGGSVNSGGKVVWQVVIKVTANSPNDVRLFYSVNSAGGDVELDQQTQPSASSLCRSTPTAHASLLGHHKAMRRKRLQHKHAGSKVMNKKLADAKAHLAKLHKAKRHMPKDAPEVEEVTAKIHEWRHKAARISSQQSKKEREFADHDEEEEDETETTGTKSEFGFGDTFFDTVYPARTVEDHKDILMQSDALVHISSRERGGSGLKRANMLSNPGFEEDVGSKEVNEKSGSVGAWLIDGVVEVGKFSRYYNLPREGQSLLHLCGNGRGTITQQIDTTAGAEYQIILSYAANAEVDKTQGVEIYVIDTDSEEQFLHETLTAKPKYACAPHAAHHCWAWRYTEWHVHQSKFTVRGTKTKIQLRSTIDDANGCMLLDDVHVALPPFHNIPDSWTFFGLTENTNCWKPAYNQGKCGSCWAFASIGALEKQYCMRSLGQSAPSLSREMLVRCSTRANACGGGTADAAYGDMMEIGGLWQTKCLPYQGEGSKHCPAFAYSWFSQDAVGKTGKFARVDQEISSRCDDTRRFSNRPPIGVEWDLPFTIIYAKRTGKMPDMNNAELMNYRRHFAKARSRDNVPSWWIAGEDAMQSALIKYGALYGSFKVWDDFKGDPSPKRMCKDHCWPWGAVYGHDHHPATCGCGCTGHAIQIIGYGTETTEDGDEIQYWQIENSWGATTHMDFFGGEPGDPYSDEHPEGAEDKCVLGFGVTDAGGGDGWEMLLYHNDVLLGATRNESAGGWICDNCPGLINVRTGSSSLHQFTLDMTPGENSITFEVHSKQHKKTRGMDNEKYGVFQPLLRCRGTAFRFDFAKTMDHVELSWNKKTRAELRDEAERFLRANNVTLNETVPECQSVCRHGRYSRTNPCTGLLDRWGRCHVEKSTQDWYRRNNYMAADCNPCDAEKALFDEKALMIKAMDNATFIQWYRIVHEALYAPDEAGWNRISAYNCQIATAGHSPGSRLNATYRFNITERRQCDARNSAMFKLGSQKIFVSPNAVLAIGEKMTQNCPKPLGGLMTLSCEAGVFRVDEHSCEALNGMDASFRGYYRMLRGANYHGIESGAAFAIAELGTSSQICPTKSWSRWTLCNSTVPCESGTQKRHRVPYACEGDTLEECKAQIESRTCQGVIFDESRPCKRPGFCPEVLTRFLGRRHGARTVEDFLGSYTRASTSLPVPTAGAHMLESIYPTCQKMKHWCSIITGEEACHIMFEAQFEVAQAGKYIVELTDDLRYGRSMGSDSEVIFSLNRDQKATEWPHYRAKYKKDMEVWVDKMELHRRRRAGKGGYEWRIATSADFPVGKHAAWVLLSGWSPNHRGECENYQLKLHSLQEFSPAVVFGYSRATTSRDFTNNGPYIQGQDRRRRYSGDRRRRRYTPPESRERRKLLNRNDRNWAFDHDDLYKALRINKSTEQLADQVVTIKGQTVLPKAGWYKVEVRSNHECLDGQYWKSCDNENNRRRDRQNGAGKPYLNLDVVGGRRRIRKDGDNDIVLDAIVYFERDPVAFTLQISNKDEAGKRIKIGCVNDTATVCEPVYETIPVPNKYVLPNSLEIHWAPYYGGKIEMRSDIKYAGEVEMVHGEDLTRITWPDRDQPFSTEYQIQPFEEVEPGRILLGNPHMMGFFAEAEGRVDAGACISLEARIPGPGSENAKGEFRGFGLQICDVDGDRQYLELFRMTFGERNQQLGWVHTEFTHPTHLILSREITSKKLNIGYRPDNRAHIATINDDFQTQLDVPESFWGAAVEVGISMGTERPYRWAEFYNITIDACPHTCDTVEGKRLYCGEVTTSCGNTLHCGASCSASDECIEGRCFGCPKAEGNETTWTCGYRSEVCHDHEGLAYDKHVPVGADCQEGYECKDHHCHCTPKTSDNWLAMGAECGVKEDGCGGNVTLKSCDYFGQNGECGSDNQCKCDKTDYSLKGYNCGEASDGCGGTEVFGHCDSSIGELCVNHSCCTPDVHPVSYECGQVQDSCTKETVTFTSAMEKWDLIFKQTATANHSGPVPSTGWYAYGEAKEDYYLKWNAADWVRGRALSNKHWGPDMKIKLKLQYSGDGIPADSFNIWKQVVFPANDDCLGGGAGFEGISINLGTDGDKFVGLCDGRAESNLLKGLSQNRRRISVDNAADQLIVGEEDTKVGLTFSVDGVRATMVELFAARIIDDSGGCPHAPRGSCNAEHECECTPDPEPEGAECGSFDNGCGGLFRYNYTGANGLLDLTSPIEAESEPLFALEDHGGNGCTAQAQCGQCQGDCDRDSDCATGFVCFQRDNSNQIVPGCKKGGSGDIGSHDYCYKKAEAKASTTTEAGAANYLRMARACVGGHNLVKYTGKSVAQCAELCNEDPRCLAFEYGVAYGGSGSYRSRDCQPQSGSDPAGCDGSHHNLDLYVKQASCSTVYVGSSSSANTLTVTSGSGLVCPTSVTRDNWLGGFTYGDTFSVAQNFNRVEVTRTDSSGGWGMPLSFMCCKAVDDEAEATEPATQEKALQYFTCPANNYCEENKCKEFDMTVPDPSDIRRCLSDDVKKIRETLLGRHVYKINGIYKHYSYISDGGGDMYDGGNRLRISAGGYSHYLRYTQECSGAWKSAGVGDVQYFTCHISSPVTVFFAVFKSESSSIDAFKVEGNLGADGRGTVSGEKLPEQWPYGNLFGYMKKVGGTTDPSINHLVLVPNKDWKNDFSTNTDNDLHTVSKGGADSVKMLMYVMFAGRDPARYRAIDYSQAEFIEVMKDIGIQC